MSRPTSTVGSGRGDARMGQAAARTPPAGGRVAVSAAGGGAEARPEGSLVTKGISSVSHSPKHPVDAPGRVFDPVLSPSTKRLMADRARALIAETCGDLPEASKVTGCGMRVRFGLADVGVEHHPDGYAYTTGLQTCGSVWICPICSFKIRMKRAAELAVAIAVHKARGGSVLLPDVDHAARSRRSVGRHLGLGPGFVGVHHGSFPLSEDP